uniref:UDP glucuronosyltransferase 5 family, polypeptide G1 n=1 Tax=Cyprinus carpio TaxID=7962 RepID=A0A8C1XB18_CYPCA
MKEISLLTCLLFVICCCHGGNILVWPEDGNHWLNMKVILRKPHSHSHSLTVVRSSKSWYIQEYSSLYSSITVSPIETEDIRDAHMQTAPSPPSHVPMYNSLLHDQMNFVQQMENFLRYLFSLLQKRYIIVPIYRELLERHFAPGTDLLTIQQSANIWLMRMDFVFEFPRPTMPNVVFMGGFQCQPAQALPTELEEFIQGSVEHGVSIISLGAVVSALPTAITEAIATAFAEIPQKVLWRYQGEQPSTLENITLILEWFPQNDLLGHPTTCVFYEAIYHGVPVSALPLLFDLFDNVLRLQVRGAARVLQVTVLTSQEFLEALKDVQTYVIRHKGAAHFHSEGNNLPWYSYHNIDMLAFLLTFTVIALLTLAYVCKLLCCRKSIKKRKVE